MDLRDGNRNSRRFTVGKGVGRVLFNLFHWGNSLPSPALPGQVQRSRTAIARSQPLPGHPCGREQLSTLARRKRKPSGQGLTSRKWEGPAVAGQDAFHWPETLAGGTWNPGRKTRPIAGAAAWGAPWAMLAVATRHLRDKRKERQSGTRLPLLFRAPCRNRSGDLVLTKNALYH